MLKKNYILKRVTPISYSSSRSAIIHASKHLAKRLANKTNVNAVILGGIESNQSKSFKKNIVILSLQKK